MQSFIIIALAATLAVSATPTPAGPYIGGSYDIDAKIVSAAENNASNHRSILDELEHQAGVVERVVVRVERGFEEATLRHNQSELKAILTELEVTKRNISVSRASLIAAVHTDRIHAFQERVMAGWVDVDFRSLDTLVTHLALEILGVNANIIDFPRTEVVDSLKSILEIAELKMSERFVQLLAKVDKEIKEAYQTLIEGKTVPSSNIRVINTDLNSIASMAKAAKDSLTSEYYPLRERLGSEGKLLDRMQKFEVERFINMLYYVEHFVHDYLITFNKAFGNSS